MKINKNNNVGLKVESRMKFHGFIFSIFIILVVLFFIFPVLAGLSEDLLNQGNRYFDRGDYQQALTAYNKSLELNPGDDIAWNNKGNCFYRLGLNKGALDAYNEAIAINPNNIQAWNGKGTVLYKLSRYQEAVISYNKALEINPNYTLSSYGLGNSLFTLREYNDALSAYNQAIRSDPDYSAAWEGKANCLYKLNMHTEAVLAYDTAIQLDPSNSNAIANRNIVLSELRGPHPHTAPDENITSNLNGNQDQNLQNELRQDIIQVFFPSNTIPAITMQTLLLAIILILLFVMNKSRNF